MENMSNCHVSVKKVFRRLLIIQKYLYFSIEHKLTTSIARKQFRLKY